MSHPTEYTAIYRCTDSVNNLKIRIRIQEVVATEPASGNPESEEWEQKSFKWQEKVFSRAEKDLYGDENNCLTDLEKKYHQDVQNSPETDATVDLYSYTNEDGFVPYDDQTDSYLARTMMQARIGDDDEDDTEQEYDFKTHLKKSIDRPVIHDEIEVMHIMADLGEYVETTWIKYEKVLCTLKFDRKCKVLSIYPDFTVSEPYCFRLAGNDTRMFHYFIDNDSETPSEQDIFKEQDLLRKISNYQVQLRNQLIDPSFTLPPKNKLYVHLFFEILWAKQFEYDTIYVQYFIDLPQNWSSEDGSELSGMTQTCHTKGEDGLGHFGHTFDVILGFNIEELEQKGIPRCPYIYFEVISKDTWERFRTEGLTYKNLPVSKPGNYRYELQCFRLMPDHFTGQLRRFFIGDCSNYDDITWVGLPKDYDRPCINKYGTNTMGTGQLAIRMNVVHHSQAFMERYNESRGKSREIFDKLSSSSLVKSVEQVLQAFKRARRNMIEARRNVN